MNKRHSRNALVLFVREPRLGEVKTRLAKTMGDEQTLSLYRRMLELLRSASLQLDVDRWVFFDRKPGDNARSFWPSDDFHLHIQEGEDVGARMHHAFTFLLEEKPYQSVVLAGSDCPQLTPNILKTSFEKLNTHDSVIGPSTDGGYYLIGMNEVIRPIFFHIPWSTEIVRSLTEDRLQQDGYSRYLLPELTDVDTEEDLELLQDKVWLLHVER